MIHYFNRAVLSRDLNAETAAKVWASLREAGIPYKVKTVKTGPANAAVRFPTSGRTGNIGANVYMGGGVPHSWMEGSANTHYIIYVMRKDLERAKEICDL